MKRGLFVGALVIAAMDVFAATVALPPPPSCDYADAEASTNLAFSLAPEGRCAFDISISLSASASNNLEVAFGYDADADGELVVEEQALTVGWDSGSWFLRNESTGERLSAPRPSGLRRLDFNLPLDFETRRPRGLFARDGGVVFAYGLKSTPDTLFDPSWNLVRVTARGLRSPQERIVVGFVPIGFIVRLR